MMMVVFYVMVSLARMYMLLALICLWFLYISLRIAKEMQVSMPEILLCVFLGGVSVIDSVSMGGLAYRL